MRASVQTLSGTWMSAYSVGAETWACPPFCSCLSLSPLARPAGGRVAQRPTSSTNTATARNLNGLASMSASPSKVPVDADEDLVPPVAQRTLLDKGSQIDAVPDEERDVLPGIELRLHGKHRPVARLVLEATCPELVEAARYHDLLLHEVVGLNAETGRGAVEVAAQLAGQAVELIPDQRAVDVEILPPHIRRDTVTQAVETLAAGTVAILGIWRADDSEAAIDERRDLA